MKRAIFLVGGLLAVVGALACATSMALQGAFEDPVERELRWEAARDAAARDAAQAATLAPVTTALWAILWSAVAVVVVVLAGAAVVRFFMWLDTYRLTRAQARLVWAEEGMYPVPVGDLLTGRAGDVPRAALAGYWQARIAEAANVGTPEHYAPVVRYEYENRQENQAGAAPVAGMLPLPTVPTFAELLARGTVGAGQPLLLGYTPDGQALTGALKDWRSGAIAGLPGAGKTTTQRFIAAQAALAGAKLVILDPHADASTQEETLAHTLAPLGSAFLCQPASAPQEMLQALHLVHELMERRLHGAPAGFSVFAFVDEATALLGNREVGPELARLLESITLQGRKTLIQCVISGQGFNGERIPTTLRDNLASTYVHRMHRNQARLLLPTLEARKVETLPTGAAVLWRADGTLADVVVPFTTGADMETVGRLLGRDAAPTDAPGGYNMATSWPSNAAKIDATYWPGAAAPGGNSANFPNSAIPPAALSPLQKRALTLWRARKPPGEIVAALFTYTPTKGPNKGQTLPVTSDAGGVYQQRLQETLQLIWSAEDLERGQPPVEGQPA